MCYCAMAYNWGRGVAQYTDSLHSELFFYFYKIVNTFFYEAYILRTYNFNKTPPPSTYHPFGHFRVNAAVIVYYGITFVGVAVQRPT